MRSLYKYTLVAMAAMAFTACSSDHGIDTPEVEENAQKVTFTIAMSTPTTSRALWSEEYASSVATAHENQIDPEALKAQIYDAAGNLIGEVQNLVWWEEGKDEGTYRFLGDVVSYGLAKGTTYRIAVLANYYRDQSNKWSDRADMSGTEINMTDDDYAAYLAPLKADTDWSDNTFDWYNTVYSSTAQRIPMWGVSSFSFEAAARQDLGTIDLLRALAKVELRISDALFANGYSLANAQLYKIATQGYILPEGYATVAKTGDLDQEGCFRGMTTNSEDKVIDFWSDGSVDGKYKTVYNYIPETPASAETYINIQIKDNNTNEVLEYNDKPIQFCSYDDFNVNTGTGFQNIVRNHHYIFEVTEITDEYLKVVYTVADWEDGGSYSYAVYPQFYHVMDANFVPFTSDPDSYTNTVATEMYYNSNYNYAEGHTDGAFSCWFNVYDEEQLEVRTWTPTINRPSAEYAVEVYKATKDATGAVTITDITNKPAERTTDPDAWYNIRVVPLAESMRSITTEGRIVELGLTYSTAAIPDFGDGIEAGVFYLPINGTVNNIALPGSGNDPNKICIKHIVK